MDSSLYTKVLTSRGITYSVFYSKGSDPNKKTLLCLHGFPSSSYDWRHQVEHFKLLGHSIIVPDMLGYGHTDKPADAESYKRSLVAKDMIDLVDAVHGDQRVVVIGHDWYVTVVWTERQRVQLSQPSFRGCAIASRLANDYEHRFLGFAFLSVGYQPPNPSISYSQLLASVCLHDSLQISSLDYPLINFRRQQSWPDMSSLAIGRSSLIQGLKGSWTIT